MFFGFLMMVGVVLLVAVVVRVIAGDVRGTNESARPTVRLKSGARRLLDERYARGELSSEEYQERLRVLEQRD